MITIDVANAYHQNMVGFVAKVRRNCKRALRKRGFASIVPAPSENHKTIVKQICDQLREEVKEMDRTAWLYDSPDPQAITI